MKFQKFFRIAKVEEQSDGTLHVYGLVTEQKPDREKEVCDYAKTKPYYEKTAAEMLKITSGVEGMETSLMPLRCMHQLEAVGKGISIDFDDPNKQIMMGFEVVDPVAITKVKKGVLPCFSHGGEYVGKKTPDPEFPGCLRYVADVGEVSLVDKGALPSAVIQSIKGQSFPMQKAAGSIELVKYDVAEDAQRDEKIDKLTADIADLKKFIEEKSGSFQKEAKTKTIAGVPLPASSFAYVGDKEDIETWHLPIDFPGDEKKTATHIQNALARFSQTKGIPDGEKESVKSKIVAAAKKHGMDVSEEAKKIAKAWDFLTSTPLQKSMWDVQDIAGVLSTLAFVCNCLRAEKDYEGDDSPVPADLHAVLTQLITVYLDLVDEETKELLEGCSPNKVSKGNKDTMLTAEQMQKKAHSIHKALGKAKEMVASHHEKMTGLHKSHCDDMTAHIEKCQKALIDESEAGGELTPADPISGGAHHEKAFDAEKFMADIEKKFSDKLEENTTNVLKAIFAAQGGDPALLKAEPAPGVGDRNQVVKTAAFTPGPQQTQPVTKDADNQPAPGTGGNAGEVTPKDAEAAFLKGDQAALLKMAKTVKAEPGGVPYHVVQAFEARRQSR